MKTETFDTPEAFMAALTGKKPRQKRGRATRPDLPAAAPSPRTGLTTLIAPKTGSGAPAWSIEYRVGEGFRLYVLGASLSTGWQADEATCCTVAKAMVGER